MARLVRRDTEGLDISSARDLLDRARDAITVKRVFGDPIEREGVTVIPVARVAGGAAGGSSPDSQGAESWGGGFGLAARPAGVYVIKDGAVRWMPAIDANRVIAGAQIVLVAMLLLARAIMRRRASR